jgi:hypothetical protein
MSIAATHMFRLPHSFFGARALLKPEKEPSNEKAKRENKMITQNQTFLSFDSTARDLRSTD